MNRKDQQRSFFYLVQKELYSYFNTAIGFIFLAFFLLVLNFLFFYGLGGNSFWEMKVASLEQFFLWIPLLYIFFLPALTMRLWAEEEKSGTLEILLTLPVQDWLVVLSKWVSAWIFLATALMSTFLTPFTVWSLGDLDMGMVFCGYMGAFLLGGANLSIGLFVSCLVKDQINAYVIGLLFLLVFFLLGYEPLLQFLSPKIAGGFAFFSLSQHFESFRLGVLDFRDVYFYASVIFLFLAWNTLLLRKKR